MKTKLPTLADKVLSNWLYKVVALVVAFAIWATTLYGQKDTIFLRNMELEFVLRPNFAVTNLREKAIQVEVEGPRQLLNKFSQSSNTVTINLTNEVEGERRIAIRPTDINLPAGVRLRSMTPNEVVVTIQEEKKP